MPPRTNRPRRNKRGQKTLPQFVNYDEHAPQAPPQPIKLPDVSKHETLSDILDIPESLTTSHSGVPHADVPQSGRAMWGKINRNK